MFGWFSKEQRLYCKCILISFVVGVVVIVVIVIVVVVAFFSNNLPKVICVQE